jgi:hypothetical protein
MWNDVAGMFVQRTGMRRDVAGMWEDPASLRTGFAGKRKAAARLFVQPANLRAGRAGCMVAVRNASLGWTNGAKGGWIFCAKNAKAAESRRDGMEISQLRSGWYRVR